MMDNTNNVKENESINNQVSKNDNKFIKNIKKIFKTIITVIKYLFLILFLIVALAIVSDNEDDAKIVLRQPMEVTNKDGEDFNISSISNGMDKLQEYYIEFYEHKIQINRYSNSKTVIYEFNLIDNENNILDSDVYIYELPSMMYENKSVYINSDSSIKLDNSKYIINIKDDNTNANINLLINNSNLNIIINQKKAST